MSAPTSSARRLRGLLDCLQQRTTGDGSSDVEHCIWDAAAVAAAAIGASSAGQVPLNVLLVFGDQWRAHAFGYAGDGNVRTPHIDALEARSVNLQTAVSGCPVCCPMRASLLTGQVPATHGVFVNDVYLRDDGKSMAQLFARSGFSTGYIGKWHVDGHGRSNYIPPARRQGFQYWKALECTHNYNESYYYAGDSDAKLTWDGYDARAQTDDAQAFLRRHAQQEGSDDQTPFLLMLSWGPPHNPYGTAPPQYRAMYNAKEIQLRPNVPSEVADQAREDLAGYYAHCTALDDCMGSLCATLDETGLTQNTLLVFFSDHGDMLGSQGQIRKQRPFEEAIRVPCLISCPRLGLQPKRLSAPFDVGIDMLPTLLDLCGMDVPSSVQGRSFADYISNTQSSEPRIQSTEAVAAVNDPSGGAALLQCAHPFGEWTRKPESSKDDLSNGREYRGLRTRTHTYVRTLEGPWLLYDLETDPYQMSNIVALPEQQALVRELDSALRERLASVGDPFDSGDMMIDKWGYITSANGTVPYTT